MVHLNVLPENASNPAKRSSDDQREKREERAQIREREGWSRLAAPTSGAIVDRAVRSTSALVRRSRRSSIDERACRTRTARRSMSGAIVRQETSALVDRDHRSLIAPLDRRSRSCTAPLVGAVRSSDERRDRRSRRSSAWRGAIVPLSLIWALSLSLSLSLFFRKWIEVKMRGEIHFRVKCEICGQPEIIFRKIMFSVTAKRMDFPEIDFWNWFSPDSNAALEPPNHLLTIFALSRRSLKCWIHASFMVNFLYGQYK